MSYQLPAGKAAPSGALDVLEGVRGRLAEVRLPLAIAGAEEARSDVAGAIAQLDDYVLPRYRSLDAPLLAVVGGSTGAGKSTLVNALVGHPVTRAGAVRPTTRRPLLLHHPDEAPWFEGTRILPGLARVRGALTKGNVPAREAGPAPEPAADGSIVLLADDAVPRGLALLDAPDVDSVADDNRRLAGQLLAAADLWVFVTTANRYADAVPWRILSEAASRDILVAVVLDRVPAEAETEVSADLSSMLEREGLGTARLFVIQEHRLDALGMLPASAVGPLREWLSGLAADAAARSAVARRTLDGAVRALAGRVGRAADALEAQSDAAGQLAADASDAYEGALTRITASTQDGALLRGEVLARWQDFVGTGELVRGIEQGIGRLRDRVGAFFRGEPPPVAKVETAIESGLLAVIVDEAATAAEDADRRWRADPAGRALLAGDDLSGPTPGFSDRAAREIRDWQGALIDLIREEGADKRIRARWISFGINGLGAALMIVVFSMTGGLTLAEGGIAAGTAVIGQKVLEAVFGDDAVRRLAKTARADLAARCGRLLDRERVRFDERLAGVAEDSDAAEALRADAESLAGLGKDTTQGKTAQGKTAQGKTAQRNTAQGKDQ
ncbi:dynamin family protein [Sinomonas cyclohexanicum]|uniref:dynamin family protein n=1 Tax=Sinomonas cyclohexanicum TaxID=322009 RepID=UPI001E2F1D49|nr:dynamin family protein [Corynebacterium cyclohexanicum]